MSIQSRMGSQTICCSQIWIWTYDHSTRKSQWWNRQTIHTYSLTARLQCSMRLYRSKTIIKTLTIVPMKAKKIINCTCTNKERHLMEQIHAQLQHSMILLFVATYFVKWNMGQFTAGPV